MAVELERHAQMTDYDYRILQDILARLEPVAESDCRVWTGLCLRGTPFRSYHGKRTSIRQILYRILINPNYNGRLQNNCETEGCLNIDHIGPWRGPDTLQRRESRLTVAERAEILATPKAIRGSGARLARRFGISASQISKIRRAQPEEHHGILR